MFYYNYNVFIAVDFLGVGYSCYLFQKQSVLLSEECTHGTFFAMLTTQHHCILGYVLDTACFESTASA